MSGIAPEVEARRSSTQYRIVRDDYLGFEVQERRRFLWWWTSWRQTGFSNTHSTVKHAEAYARKMARKREKQRVVKYLDLPAPDSPEASQS